MSSKEDVAAEGLREAFEEAVFTQYFMSTIKNTGRGGPFNLVSVDCKTKAEFLVRTENGSYVDDTLNAAWWAWKKATKVARTYTQAKGEAANEYLESFGAIAPKLPGTLRFSDLFECMARADDPHGFKVGDRVHFARHAYQFVGHVTALEGSRVVCLGVELGCESKVKELARISFLQSLRVVTDEGEWARLTGDEPAFAE